MVIWRYLNIYIQKQNFKNEKMKTISIFFWMGQIIIPTLLVMVFFKDPHQKYIFQLTKCEPTGV